MSAGQFSTRIQSIPYESPILGQLLDLISPAKINFFEPRFESYDPYDMANPKMKDRTFQLFFQNLYLGTWTHTREPGPK